MDIYDEIADCVFSVLDNEFNEDAIEELISFKNELPKTDKHMRNALQNKIDYASGMYKRCNKCGSKLETKIIKEIHSELDSRDYESFYEKYCPNCGVYKEA